jgi:hypothetical protein
MGGRQQHRPPRLLEARRGAAAVRGHRIRAAHAVARRRTPARGAGAGGRVRILAVRISRIDDRAAAGTLGAIHSRCHQSRIGAPISHAQASLLAIGLTHAERVFDLATSVHDGLLRCADPGAAEFLERTARRASVWEHECDVLVTRIRSLARRTATPEVYAALMHAVDDAADGLEEAAFLMTHLSAAPVSDELIETVRVGLLRWCRVPRRNRSRCSKRRVM